MAKRKAQLILDVSTSIFSTPAVRRRRQDVVPSPQGGIDSEVPLYSSLITRTFGDPWGVPWREVALIAGVILATTALAVRGPAKRLRGLSIVENIHAQ